jgi:hypothetical protein
VGLEADDCGFQIANCGLATANVDWMVAASKDAGWLRFGTVMIQIQGAKRGNLQKVCGLFQKIAICGL